VLSRLTCYDMISLVLSELVLELATQTHAINEDLYNECGGTTAKLPVFIGSAGLGRKLQDELI
jgi:hypothetical protein